MTEYDIHAPGMRADDATAALERIVSDERARGSGVFAVITGYGSRGGTSVIRDAVLRACSRYAALNHIRGYMPGDQAGDPFAPLHASFPDAWSIPARYKRSPNPGMVFICV